LRFQNESREEIFKVRDYSKPSMSTTQAFASRRRRNAMTRKAIEESHNQTDMRYIRNHPKHDRFPARRGLGLAALLIVVAVILLVVLPSQWLI
jgi:hypothetical protein